MALSWNEIKDRALKFTKEWEQCQQQWLESLPTNVGKNINTKVRS